MWRTWGFRGARQTSASRSGPLRCRRRGLSARSRWVVPRPLSRSRRGGERSKRPATGWRPWAKATASARQGSGNELRDPPLPKKSSYVNSSPDSNSLFCNHLIKTEAFARPARRPRPQDVEGASARESWSWLLNLIIQGDGDNALGDESAQAVLDPVGLAVIAEAGRHTRRPAPTNSPEVWW